MMLWYVELIFEKIIVNRFGYAMKNINICHHFTMFFVIYIKKTMPKFLNNCKFRFCILENIILESKIIHLPRVWVELCHIPNSICTRRPSWILKSQAGGRWPPTWNFIYGVISCRNCNKMIVTKHCKIHCSGCPTNFGQGSRVQPKLNITDAT